MKDQDLSENAMRRTHVPFVTILLVLLSTGICLYLGSMFLAYEPAIRQNGDIAEYRTEAEQIAALRQGQDVTLTQYYPPLANVVFYVAYNNVFGMPFHRGLLFTVLLACILAGGFVVEFLGKEDLQYVMLAVPATIALLEPAVFFARFDAFPMLAILLVWLCMRRGRFGYAGAFLVIGILVKFSPIFLAPLVYACTPKEKRRELFLGMGMTLVAIGALMTVVLTARGMMNILAGFLSLRAGHPPYVFSRISSIDLFVRMLLGTKGAIQWIPPNIGHFNVGFPSWTPLALQFLSVAGALLIAKIARNDALRLKNMALYISAVMLWVLATTPLLTMHYYLWILPIPLAWFLEETERTQSVKTSQFCVGILTVIVALLGQYFYPYAYFDLVNHQTPITVSLNLLRNLLTFLLVIACLQAVQTTKTLQNS